MKNSEQNLANAQIITITTDDEGHKDLFRRLPMVLTKADVEGGSVSMETVWKTGLPTKGKGENMIWRMKKFKEVMPLMPIEVMGIKYIPCVYGKCHVFNTALENLKCLRYDISLPLV